MNAPVSTQNSIINSLLKWIDHAPDIIMVSDRSDIIIYINAEGAELLGYTTSELIGKTVSAVVQSSDEMNENPVVRHFNAPPVTRRRFQMIHRNGRLIVCEGYYNERADDSTASVFIGTLNSLDSIRIDRLAAEKQISTDQTDGAFVFKSRQIRRNILAMLSSDIRSSLMTIMGITEYALVAGESRDRKSKINLDRIMEAAEKILLFMHDAESSMQVFTPHHTMTPVVLPVNDLVIAAMQPVQDMIGRANVRIFLDIPDSLPGLIADNATMLTAFEMLLFELVTITAFGTHVAVSAYRNSFPNTVIVEFSVSTPASKESLRTFNALCNVHGLPPHTLTDAWYNRIRTVNEIIVMNGGELFSEVYPESGLSVFMRIPSQP